MNAANSYWKASERAGAISNVELKSTGEPVTPPSGLAVSARASR